MPAISELNAAPYWDDFSPEEKDYLRILFRPGYAVQARELNQLQSILQTQVERFGNHIFKDGSIVVGGLTTINTKTRKYIKIKDTYSGDEVVVTNFLNKRIVGATSEAVGIVVAVAERDGEDPKTLIIEPVSGEFDVNNETITADGGVNCTTMESGTVSGPSSTASIDTGIFFTKGFFVICNKQTTFLEKYSNTPNKKAGLLSEIALIDEGDDDTLLDNATGSYNYAAPGAHRLKVNLTLTSKDLDYTTDSDKFIDLLEVRDGALYKQVTRPIYSELEKTLARRTYDESGDYTVKPFIVDIQDHPDDSSKLRAYIEPGKAYVKGYEFETIAREYIDLNKPRSNADDETFNGFDIGMNYGNYVTVTIDEGIPDISSFETLYLYNIGGSQIGTCRVSSVKYDSTVTSVKRYRFYLFDIRLTTGAGFSDVRSIRSSDGTTKKFDLVAVSGATGILSGTDLSSYIFETGFNSIRTFRNEDPINPGTFINSTDTDFQYKGVYTSVSTGTSWSWTVGSNETLQSGNDSSTKAEHYMVVRNDTDEELAPADYTLTISGSNRTAQIDSLVGSITGGISVIYTVNANSTEARIKTKVSPKTNAGFAGSVGNTATTIKLASNANDETTNFYQNAMIKIISGTGVMTGATGFRIVSYDETTQIATIDGATGFLAVPDASSYYEIAPPTSSFTYNSSDLNVGRVYVSSVLGATGPDFSLTVPDGVRIHKILNSTSQGDWFDPAKDVTSKFNFDNGQRDFTYELSSVRLKPGETVSGPINIFFEYFTHTGSGYFNVDSYPDYDEIPIYSSSTGKLYDLRNCVDFRPVKSGSNYATSVLPISGTNMNADVTYWKPRIDKIVATTDREFKVIEGNPSLNPKPPSDMDNAMTLYTIYYNPYTFNNKDIVLNYVENKRYTMRDIGRIEKRLETVEYYSLLNMLERETATLDVTDANGNDRFKNGFVVDTFTGHGIGDVTNLNYRCSIDERKQEARPRFYTKNYELYLKTTESSGYTQRGRLISRSFTSTDYIKQPFASQTVNVNPFSVFAWRGTMSIDPSVDFWKDDRYRPENVINVNSTNDNVAIGHDWSGTRWNNWEENFNGTSEDDRVEERLARGELGANLPAATVNLDPRNAMFDIRDWRYEEVVQEDGSRVPSWIHRVTGNVAPAFVESNESVQRRLQASTTTGTRVQNHQPVRSTTTTTNISLGDRVVDVSLIPWMRSKTITFIARGLKPNTRVYPFFDDILISQYVSFNVVSVDGSNTLTTGFTNSNGSIAGTFTIPENKFLVGDRILRLSDNVDNNKTLETTFAQARYTANGILTHRQTESVNIRATESIIGTYGGLDAQTALINSRTPIPIDPLAQTFFVDPTIYPNGLFIESVDLFFKTKDSNGIPVTVQIRPTVNGYPSSTAVIPFAEKTLPPSSVNIDTTGATATNFQFPEIVYLQPGEYSIVILANSTSYEVFVAEIGQKKIGSDELISQQPYVGSLFKSQNSSTWTAEQTQDLKFTLKRCNFTLGSFTVVLSDYINASAPSRSKTATGTSGAFTIRVNNNDGIAIGQSVSGTGIGTSAEVTAINGFFITLSVANTSTVNGSVTFTGKSSGDSAMDVMWLGLSTLEFPTSAFTSSFVSKPTGSSLETTYTPVITNTNYEFSGRREIIANQESLKHKIVGNISSTFVSPIIDLEKSNYIAIENDINNLVERTTTTTGATGFNSTVLNVLSSQYIVNGNIIKSNGEYMLVTAGGGSVGATGVTVQRGILGTGATGIASGETVYINSESFPTGGAAASKYITRPIVLQNAADYLKVYLTAVKRSGSDIKVYYKIKAAEDSDRFSNKSWVEMQKEYPSIDLNSTNDNDFREFIFRPDSTLHPETISYTYNGVTYTTFNEFAIKIVFLSSNSTIIPRIADFRAIALDTIV